MRIIHYYRTKAKWALYHKNGIPITGYDYDAAKHGEQMAPGANVLLYGRLYMAGTTRGRSSAKFSMVSPSGDKFTMTLTGAEKLFAAVAGARMKTQMDIWVEDEVWMDRAVEHTVPSFTGYWTVSKQGTDYALIPAPLEIIP